jgi:hypothetical protein
VLTDEPLRMAGADAGLTILRADAPSSASPAPAQDTTPEPLPPPVQLPVQPDPAR